LNFNSLYQRVRIDAMQIKKQKPEPFQRRLQKFIENTKQGDRVFLNGEEVTKEIREKEVTKVVSPVSAIKEVRLEMVNLQRKLAEGKNIIMEGRRKPVSHSLSEFFKKIFV